MRRHMFKLAVMAALALPALALAADLRLQLNPALARMEAEDPQAAARVLDALDAILQGREIDEPLPKSRGIDAPEAYEGLLEDNPLLQEAYRIDPKAALTQLKEIVAIAGSNGG